jgi:uncharacterized membrane protein
MVGPALSPGCDHSPGLSYLRALVAAVSNVVFFSKSGSFVKTGTCNTIDHAGGVGRETVKDVLTGIAW